MIRVTVPATSANLGSGFDSMGVALRLYNVISMCPWDTIDITVRNGIKIRRDASNLIYKTVAHVYQLCGKELYGLRVVEDAHIPKTRGLGSSSACIVAGILGANEMLGRPLSLRDMIDLAARLEGHPDNSTPAIIGGVTVSVLENGRVYYTKIPMKKKLQFVALIPEFHLETNRARAALPSAISHESARFNLARAALLTASISQGKLCNLKVAMQDQLHQEYRFDLIPGGRELCDALYREGALGVYISGAGPTIVAVSEVGDHAFEERLNREIFKEFSNWKLNLLRCDTRGARVKIDKPKNISEGVSII